MNAQQDYLSEKYDLGFYGECETGNIQVNLSWSLSEAQVKVRQAIWDIERLGRFSEKYSIRRQYKKALKELNNYTTMLDEAHQMWLYGSGWFGQRNSLAQDTLARRLKWVAARADGISASFRVGLTKKEEQ